MELNDLIELLWTIGLVIWFVASSLYQAWRRRRFMREHTSDRDAGDGDLEEGALAYEASESSETSPPGRKPQTETVAAESPEPMREQSSADRATQRGQDSTRHDAYAGSGAARRQSDEAGDASPPPRDGGRPRSWEPPGLRSEAMEAVLAALGIPLDDDEITEESPRETRRARRAANRTQLASSDEDDDLSGLAVEETLSIGEAALDTPSSIRAHHAAEGHGAAGAPRRRRGLLADRSAQSWGEAVVWQAALDGLRPPVRH